MKKSCVVQKNSKCDHLTLKSQLNLTTVLQGAKNYSIALSLSGFDGPTAQIKNFSDPVLKK